MFEFGAAATNIILAMKTVTINTMIMHDTGSR